MSEKMDYQKIILTDGDQVFIDFSARRKKCQKCSEMVRFAINQSGKCIPTIELPNGEFEKHFLHNHAPSPNAENEDRIKSIERNERWLNEM